MTTLIKRSTTIFATLVLGTMLSVPAHAGLIDFTDGTWSSGGNTDSQVISGFGLVSIEAYADGGGPGMLNFNESGPSSTPPCDLLDCTTDGAGIDDDEITFGTGGARNVERLKVTTERPFTLGILHFLDLFGAPDTGNEPAEVAEFRINGSNAMDMLGSLQGTKNDGVGYEATADLNIPDVTMIEFFASSAEFSFETIGPDSNTDFAVAAIQSVPEPGILGLLGAGLLGLGLGARRRAT